jgi:hypothetical protein
MEAEVNNAQAHEHSHMVQYSGNLYRTLDGTSPLDTNVYCQNYFLSLQDYVYPSVERVVFKYLPNAVYLG